MAEPKSVKDSINELADNLGTLGLFMVGEVRAFMRKSWGASRDEFMAALDQVAKSMKHSGKWAAQDIERAVEQIKKNWEALDKQGSLEWETFLNEVNSRLKTIGDVSKETFDQAADFAKKSLDRHWEAVGRPGEEHIQKVREHSDKMAEAFKDQWGVFRDTMEKTGKKIDRAIEAAWEELKKK